MAATGTNRPSAAGALPMIAALLMALLIATPASASQLNLYKGKWCTESFTVCWDRQCCNVPSDAVSYKFYYNPDWKAYLYKNAGCSGESAAVANNIDCVQGVDFKSALLTDGSSSNLQFVAEE